MPDNRFANYWENVKTARFETVLATVESAYEGDGTRNQLLSDAIDVVNQEIKEGSIPTMDKADLLTLAVQLVEDELAQGEETKQAEAETTEDYDEENIKIAESYYNMGDQIAVLMEKHAGITREELLNVSAEDAPMVAQLAAQLVYEDNLQREQR